MCNPLFCRINLLLLAMIVFVVAPARADTTSIDRAAAVIFDYQRIGEDLYPATNTSTEQFNSHLQELTTGGYHIAPLDEIVSALKNGDRLPDRTVAITFDGAYKSALQNAIPLLLDKDIPFTVFFSPDQADANTPDYMNWDDIRKLSRNTHVEIGLHPADYVRLGDATPEEMHRQINKALSLYRAKLKTEPDYFAYPFGEHTKAYRQIITDAGFKAAFGQQSGVAYAGSDPMALPRFAMTESYADDDRFKMEAEALPMPVSDISPDDPHITTQNPPTFGFSIDAPVSDKLAQMSCFISEQGKPQMQIVGKNRVELRVKNAFNDDRVRVNCTLPGPKPKPGEDQRWRWFGMLLSVAHGTPDDDSNDNNAEPDSGRPD